MKHADSSFFRLFNFRDETSVGRSMILLHTFFTGIANIFITGTFYTGFLTNNGIDIVRVGIITFIPYFAWIFGLFGPKLMARFKKRRSILIFNHVFYYVCVVLATTLMPMVVSDPGQRTLWFGVFLLLGNVSNALIGSGLTAWHLHFIPDGQDRNFYFSVTNLVTNLTGTAAAIGASLLTDSLAGSPHQAQVIVVMRLVSFVLMLFSGLALLLVPKEYPYTNVQSDYSLKDVFFRPIRNKKFFLSILVAVAWNCIGNFNAGTWSYYILNTVGMKYALTYTSSVVCAIGGIFLLSGWRQMINRFGWSQIIFVNVVVTGVLELVMSMTTANTVWIYVLGATISGLNLIGAQITFANVFYINLPKNDPDIYITFYNFMIYIFIFLGSAFGTWLLSVLEKSCSGLALLGQPLYGSQVLCWIKCVCYLALAFYIWKVTPIVQPKDA